MAKSPGTLYVVATPIGNMGDLSPRARAVLAEVSAICAEDTRRTGTMLRECGIQNHLFAVHDHNEEQASAGLIERLQAGDDLALVSDAGTPLVSDPGFRLVRAAREAGCKVSPVPGPCAAIAALSVAGIASDRFCFEGFLAQKSAARRERINDLACEPRTLIFYESSHRIEATLDDLISILGPERPALIGRELTKLFETLIGGSLGEIREQIGADPNQRKGEFVLILQGARVDVDARLQQGRKLFEKLKEHLKPSQAARVAAEISGASRKDLYSVDGD